jgi:hypothetical protein
MEHLPPTRPAVRLLYWIRIRVVGGKDVDAFAGCEHTEIGRFFTGVKTIVSGTRKTKAVLGYKPTAR